MKGIFETKDNARKYVGQEVQVISYVVFDIKLLSF